MRKKLFKKLVVTGAMISMLSTSMSAFAAETYTVQEGDYLKKIAQQIYGDAEMWEEIYQANQESIANPNIIYKGQVLTLPGAGAPAQGTDKTTPADQTETTAPETAAAPETETPAPAADAPAQDSAAIKNVPVGVNPEISVEPPYVEYKYTLDDGSRQVTVVMLDYVSTQCEDAYGIRYVGPECNKIMQCVDDFIAQNPDSDPAYLLNEYGDQFVFVSSDLWVWYYEPDYGDDVDVSWAWGWVDCEPEDCVYVFLRNDEIDSEQFWAGLFEDLSRLK